MIEKIDCKVVRKGWTHITHILSSIILRISTEDLKGQREGERPEKGPGVDTDAKLRQVT